MNNIISSTVFFREKRFFIEKVTVDNKSYKKPLYYAYGGRIRISWVTTLPHALSFEFKSDAKERVDRLWEEDGIYFGYRIVSFWNERKEEYVSIPTLKRKRKRKNKLNRFELMEI